MSVTIQSLGPATVATKGADVASSGTVTLVSGTFQHITGTTTITDVDFDTATNGAWAWVTFDGALTLTYNATSLKLPGSANILTQAGDTALFVQDSGDNVICLVYNRVQAGQGAPKEAAVASAGTTVLKAGAVQHITGTTTITDIDFDSANDGNFAWVIFDGALTLTHNATTLILPGGANITTAAGDRALFYQDSSDNVYCLVYEPASGGTNKALYLPLAGGTLTGQLIPSAGIKYEVIANFTPLHNQPPASNYATLSTRNSEPVLQFDTTTQEGAVFGGNMPYDYGGGSIRVTIWSTLASAITGTLGWVVAFEAMSAQDTDSDGFAADQTATAATVPGTSGVPMTHQVTFTQAQADGVAAGEAFRLRIRRDVATDTAAGDAELIRVLVEEI